MAKQPPESLTTLFADAVRGVWDLRSWAEEGIAAAEEWAENHPVAEAPDLRKFIAIRDAARKCLERMHAMDQAGFVAGLAELIELTKGM